MKRLLPFALFLLAGCSIVPTDTGWPKPAWYWSYEAKQQRKERREGAVQDRNYRECLAELNQQLTLRRTEIVDLSAVGRSLVKAYGVSLVSNIMLNEWQSGTTNIYTQSLVCDVMWVQNQAPREQDLSWMLCYHSQWDGSK